jgi:hypothetical protein
MLRKLVLLGIAIAASMATLTTPALAQTLPPPVPNVQIHSVDDGRCLEIKGGSSVAGDAAGAGTCNLAALNQQWDIEPTSDGYHQIVVKHTPVKMCLNVGWASLDNGQAVGQYPCGKNNEWLNDQWRIVHVGDNQHLIVARHSGKCLDKAGNDIVQWACHGRTWQRWVTSLFKPLV